MDGSSVASRARRRIPPAIAVSLLLALFVVSGWVSLRRDSATSDETPHIAAGISYLETGDFRMNPEHPPLAKVWAALAPWLLGRARPDYGSAAWRGSDRTRAGNATGADEWVFGFETLNGPLASEERRDPRAILLPARAMMLALGVALGLVVWAWSRKLWGEGGALVSLFLFALSPTMLAHARLVTTDIAAALGFTLAAWRFREYLARPGARRLVLAGASLAAALLLKFSAVLLVPILLLAAGAWVVLGGEEEGSWRRRAAIAAIGLAGAGLFAWIGIWAGYGFRWAAAAPGYALGWESRETGLADIPSYVLWARDLKLLPEAWVFGLGAAIQDQVRLAYFHGEVSMLGFRLYFPAAFLLKTPPALLPLSLWAVAGGMVLWRRRRLDGVVLATTFAVYAASALASRLNLGHRHLAPLEPLLFVACGAIPALADRTWKRAAAGVLLAAYAASWAAATPNYLSYFNALAGGPRGGARWLLDSNLDWGQDLGRLAEWMRRERVETVDLAYFGTADPKAYGVRYRKLYAFLDFRPEEPASRPKPGDVVAVSVNLLHGLFLRRDEALADVLVGSGLVPPERIAEYSRLLDERVRAREAYPTMGEWLVARGLVTPPALRAAEDRLAATWIERLRTTERPIGYAGDSIWIYRAP